MPGSSIKHEQIMQRCLELALKAEGRTAPNPLVGAVIVDSSGCVIAEGFHTAAGYDHAEVAALKEAGDRARNCTLYVNLEPCCHFGKTPPCTDAIITAGIKQVVYGCSDRNPQVAGRGQKKLLAAGIEVIDGVLEKDCYFVNRAFFKRIECGRPWVILKVASTLNGVIADRHGKSKWITGPASRQAVHELRNKCDAILTTSSTVLADDPELTVRDVENALNPQRLIIDTFKKVPAGARIFFSQKDDRDLGRPPVLVFCKTAGPGKTSKTGSDLDTVTATAETNISLQHEDSALFLSTPTVRQNGQERIDLKAALTTAAQYNINTILVEAGGKMNGALWEEGLVDEIYWFIAPKILPDAMALPAIISPQVHLLEGIANLAHSKIHHYGEDVLMHGLTSLPGLQD